MYHPTPDQKRYPLKLVTEKTGSHMIDLKNTLQQVFGALPNSIQTTISTKNNTQLHQCSLTDIQKQRNNHKK